MESAVCFAASPLPVAWLQGNVLAEYLRFLEESAPPPPMRVPRVAWLEGEVRDEFLQFLEESRAVAAAVAPDRQQEEEEELAARDGGDDADGYDDGGIVVDDDHGSFVDDGGESGFMEDDAFVMVEDDEGEDGGAFMEKDDKVGEDGGVFMEKDEQEAEAVLDLLLPHILDLPAFRARAAAPAALQQEPALGFPLYYGGWLQRRVSLFEVDSFSPSSSSDEEMSSVEEEIKEGASICYQHLASDSSSRHSYIS